MHHLLFLNIGTQEMVLIIIICLALPLYCMFDILKSTFKETSTKLLWLLVVLIVPFVGSLLYLMVGKSDKLA
jgi:hypothetical protein